MMATLGPRMGGSLNDGIAPQRIGNQNPMRAPSDVYRTRDGRHVFLMIHHNRVWAPFCRAFGRPQWIDDARYADNQLRCAEYLSFVTTFILAMGIVFQMPAIIFILVRIGLVKRPWLTKQRRYVFLGVFLLGALITPTPDPFNQALVALPMYALFEFGLLISRFGVPRASS